jgi:hypothetical protein
MIVSQVLEISSHCAEFLSKSPNGIGSIVMERWHRCPVWVVTEIIMHLTPVTPNPTDPIPMPPPPPDPNWKPGVKEPPPQRLPDEEPNPNPDEERSPPKQSWIGHSAEHDDA